MDEMTVGELIASLQDYPEDAPVRLAQQPAWPFEYRIGEPASAEVEDEREVIYLPEAGQIGYLPGAARDELGWR